MADPVSPSPLRPDIDARHTAESRQVVLTSTAPLWISGAVLLTIIVLPIVAVFIRAASIDVLSELVGETVVDALTLSLVTSFVTLLITLIIGTP
ncbi:MAG: hypothetical protein ACOC9Y_10840, partial [Chloroflexota bacterium]